MCSCGQACAREKAAPAAAPPVASEAAAPLPLATTIRPAQRLVNGARTMQYIHTMVGFGPRYLGSAGHKKCEDYLRRQLHNDTVEEDHFAVDSPEGKFAGRNFMAKFPGTKDGIIVIGGHYETPYPLRKTTFIGANDGGSSAAILLELANQLRGRKLEGYSVWLVWFDAEEAMRTWSATDSLYGSRHLAARWQQDGTTKKIRAFLLADMIGDADLNIEHDANSTPWLEDMLYQAATRLGHQSHFFARSLVVEDDHLPFVRIGVPAADVIDLDYGYENVFHHSTEDTLDKLSPRSLEIAGDVILETVALVNERP
jgi:Zn-dependent M28 family amino/carboxypeptidase